MRERTERAFVFLSALPELLLDLKNLGFDDAYGSGQGMPWPPKTLSAQESCQFVSTDYVVPDLDFSTYSAEVPGGYVGRCNPISAPADCDSALIRP